MSAAARQEGTVFGEFLDAIIACIDDEKIVIRVKSKARRTVEFPFARAAGAPTLQEISIGIKDGNAIEPVIGEVHISL
jgi:hypothetical protein